MPLSFLVDIRRGAAPPGGGRVPRGPGTRQPAGRRGWKRASLARHPPACTGGRLVSAQA